LTLLDETIFYPKIDVLGRALGRQHKKLKLVMLSVTMVGKGHVYGSSSMSLSLNGS
jgi:hypothetical protein